jgi:tetratricopeptide (TPR) repeat protein
MSQINPSVSISLLPVVVCDGDGKAYRSLLIGRKTRISFHRTLRVPEDGNDYPLPAGLGNFPIHRVEDYADTVPTNWLEEGGFFIPLYQKEALFIQFEGEEWRPSIAKVCVGNINAITGKPYSEQLSSHSQDYVIIPKQEWLDGINSGDGTVKQFVAMPLGQGYTLEAQITDEEKYGGFQLVVYEPVEGRFKNTRDRSNKIAEHIINDCMRKFDFLIDKCGKRKKFIVTKVQENMWLAKIAFMSGCDSPTVEEWYEEFRSDFYKIVEDTINQYNAFHEDDFTYITNKVIVGLKKLGLREKITSSSELGNVLGSSPTVSITDMVLRASPSPTNYDNYQVQEMGIAAGGTIKQQIYPDTYGVNSWDFNQRRSIKLHIVNSIDYKKITGQEPPASPITTDQYHSAGIPWFEKYDEITETIKAAASLKRIAGVAQIDKQRGIGKSRSEEQFEVNPDLIKRIKTPDVEEVSMDFWDRAKQSMVDGRWNDAIREIDYLTDLKIYVDASIFADRAHCNFQISRFLEAVVDADTALELDSNSSHALAIRARSRLKLGDYLGVKEDCQNLTQVAGQETLGHELMAEADLHLGDYAGAIKSASILESLEPNHPRAKAIISEAKLKDFWNYYENEYRPQ